MSDKPKRKVEFKFDESPATGDPLVIPEIPMPPEAAAQRFDPKDRIGCICRLTTPCGPMCSCVVPYSSVGCRRCCKYGSLEHRRAKAAVLAKIIDAGEEAVEVLSLIEELRGESGSGGSVEVWARSEGDLYVTTWTRYPGRGLEQLSYRGPTLLEALRNAAEAKRKAQVK